MTWRHEYEAFAGRLAKAFLGFPAGLFMDDQVIAFGVCVAKQAARASRSITCLKVGPPAAARRVGIAAAPKRRDWPIATFRGSAANGRFWGHRPGRLAKKLHFPSKLPSVGAGLHCHRLTHAYSTTRRLRSRCAHGLDTCVQQRASTINFSLCVAAWPHITRNYRLKGQFPFGRKAL